MKKQKVQKQQKVEKKEEQKNKQQQKNDFIQSPVPTLDKWVKRTANDKDYKLQRQKLDKFYHQDKKLSKSIDTKLNSFNNNQSIENNSIRNNAFLANRNDLKKTSKSNPRSGFGLGKMQFVVIDDIFGLPKQIDKNLLDNQKDNYFKTSNLENNLLNQVKSQNFTGEQIKQSNIQSQKPIKYSNVSNLNDERPYKDKLHNWNKKENEIFESQYDWNQNNVKSMFKSSAGFRMMEDSHKLTQPLVNNQIPESEFANKDLIYEKLGIPQNAQKTIVSPETIERIPERYFEIKESYFHSQQQDDIKQEFRNQVIDELEEKRQKLKLQREILMNRNEHIVNIDLNARQLANDSIDQNMIFEQKFANIPKSFKNVFEDLAKKENEEEKQKQKDKEELKPFMQNVENLIENIWEQEKPDLNSVENKIHEHRQHMKDIESLYIKKRMLIDKQIRPIEGLYQDLEQEKIKISDQTQLKLQNEEKNVFQAVKKEEQKQVLSLEERDAKRKKIMEEMAKLDKELNKKPDLQVDYIIKPSEKVLKKLDYVPDDQKQYNTQFQQYLIDKEINQQYTQQLDNFQKPEFIKFQKTEKSKNNINGFSISHRPQSQKQQNEEDILKENLEVYYESLENHKRSDEHKMLFKKILDDKLIRKQKNQYKDEEFIIKFLFQEIDKSDGKIVSKQEIYEYISKQKDAIIFFDLCLTTLKIDLENFKTNRLGLLNMTEFGQFIRIQKDIAKESLKLQKIELEKQQREVEKEIEQQIIFEYNQQIDQGTCILDKNSIEIIKNIFQSLQVEDIVEKESFFNSIFQNLDIIEADAIQIPYTDRKLKLKQILPKINKNDTFLTIKQFFNSLKKYQYEPIIDDFEIKYDIQQEYLILLHDIFDMTPRITGEIVSSKIFAKFAKSDPQIKAFMKLKVRKQCQDPSLINENIGDVLERLIKECDDQSNWDTIKIYFSQQGRPQIKDKISTQEYFQKEQILKDVLNKRQQFSPFNDDRQLQEIDKMNANFDFKQSETQQIFIDKLNQKPVFDIQEQEEISQKLKEFDQFYKDLKKNTMIYELSPSRDKNYDQQLKPLDRPEKIYNLKDFKVDYDPLFKKMGKKKSSKIPVTVPQEPTFMKRPHVESTSMKRLKEELSKKEEDEKKQNKQYQKKKKTQMEKLGQDQKIQEDQIKSQERTQNILKETRSKYNSEDVPQVYQNQKQIKQKLEIVEEKQDNKYFQNIYQQRKPANSIQKRKEPEKKVIKDKDQDEAEEEEAETNKNQAQEEEQQEEQEEQEKEDNIDDVQQNEQDDIGEQDQLDDDILNQDQQEEDQLDNKQIDYPKDQYKQDNKVEKKGGLSTIINKDRKNIDNTKNIKGFFAKEIKQDQQDEQLKDGIAGFFKKNKKDQKNTDNYFQEQQIDQIDDVIDINDDNLNDEDQNIEQDNPYDEQLKENQEQNEYQDKNEEQQEDQQQEQQEDQLEQQEDQQEQQDDEKQEQYEQEYQDDQEQQEDVQYNDENDQKNNEQEQQDDNDNEIQQSTQKLDFSVKEAMNEVENLNQKLQNIIQEKNKLGGQKVTKAIQLQEEKKLKEKELEIKKKIKELEQKIERENKIKEQKKLINEKFQTLENQKQKQLRADQKKQELKEKEESLKLQDEQRKKEQQEKLNNRQKLSEKKNLGSNTLAILRKLPSYLTEQ